MKDSKYMDAWILLEQYLIKGIDIPKDVLHTLYELVEMYYSHEESVCNSCEQSERGDYMTNNEAIEILLSYMPKDNAYNVEDRKAFNMAIDALKNQNDE